MSEITRGAIIIEGHVQGLSNVRSLGEMGVPVFVIDKNDCIARYSKFCRKFFRCPDYYSEEFVDFLVGLAKKEAISEWLLLPSNDHAVYNISKNKKQLEKYYKVVTPDIEIVERIYDKVSLLEVSQRAGVPIPSTQCFIQIDEPVGKELAFPILTKGRNGLSFYKALGKKAFLARNESELREQLKTISEKYYLNGTFSQELIPNDGSNKTLSLAAFCENGEIMSYWMGAKIREHPIDFGTATYTRSVLVPECLENSKILLKELNYTGVCEVEFLRDPRTNEYKLIEINARTWLWVGHARACGVDFAKYAYNFINNIPTVYPTNYKIGLGWFNPFTDLVFSVIGILKGQIKVKEYISTLCTKRINALFYKSDNKPAFAYLFKIFFFVTNR
jgi:predicted ATP-grasp superfamily ATP-dependent carboligase